MKKLIWTLILVCPSLFAQGDSISYIRTFPEKITVRSAYLNTSNDFRITDTDNGSSILLKPNTREYVGISVLFRSLELDLGYAPKFLRENTDNENSKLFTMNFRMFLGKWMQTVDFYQQKSFTAIIEDGEVPLPDVETLKIGGGTSYIFNPNFSFRAIGFQNEWQQKSAGSFIPRFSFYYTRYDLVDGDLNDEVDSFDIAVGPGYFYNFVIDRNFLLSAGGNFGTGVNISSDNSQTLTSLLLEANFRGAIGYNSERFFTGINTNFLVLEHNENRNTRVDDEILFLEIYLGYRFDAPKKFVKWADDFNDKFGL